MDPKRLSRQWPDGPTFGRGGEQKISGVGAEPGGTLILLAQGWGWEGGRFRAGSWGLGAGPFWAAFPRRFSRPRPILSDFLQFPPSIFVFWGRRHLYQTTPPVGGDPRKTSAGGPIGKKSARAWGPGPKFSVGKFFFNPKVNDPGGTRGPRAPPPPPTFFLHPVCFADWASALVPGVANSSRRKIFWLIGGAVGASVFSSGLPWKIFLRGPTQQPKKTLSGRCSRGRGGGGIHWFRAPGPT